MKLIIYILFLINITSCSKKQCDETTIRPMNDTILTKDFECLDINFIKGKGNQHTDKEMVEHYEYREDYGNGAMKLYVNGSDRDGCILFKSIDYNNFLSISKSFYIDGRIKYKGYFNDLGFKIGKWYYFDEYGNLEKIEDYEKKFDYTFEQLKERLEKEEKFNFNRLEFKNNGAGIEYLNIKVVRTIDPKPLWIVEYDDKTNSANGLWGTRIEIWYNGKTGEEIQRDIRPQNP